MIGQSLVAQPQGFESLRYLGPQGAEAPQVFYPNPAYTSYLKIHKVLVGPPTAGALRDTYASLRREDLPRYLSAAGWAAVEAAVVDVNASTTDRVQLIEGGVRCWQQGIANQMAANSAGTPHLVEHSAPFRLAMDIATVPLLKGVVLGAITRQTCRTVFEDALRVAQANSVQQRLAEKEGDRGAAADHIGFGHECNGLLGFNRQLSPTWFVITASARADSGHHHPEQTHDLSIVHQTWGEIRSVVPVEVKAAASQRDRARYQALLVRGKMHLLPEGSNDPTITLDAIIASYEGHATHEQQAVASSTTRRLTGMLRDYLKGQPLRGEASARTATRFHDRTIVAQHHPGLSMIDQQG